MKEDRIQQLDLLSWLVCTNERKQGDYRVDFVWPSTVPFRNEFLSGLKEKYKNIICLIDKICNAKNSIEPYGIARLDDFDFESSRTVARLFAYDNKHYYVYKAISNPNKLGYLSRKQYYKALLLKRHAEKHGETFDVKAYLKETGTMASPFKLLKQAFKENKEATKFLSAWFPLQEDGKLKYEDTLIMITNQLLRINLNNYKFVETPIDECYDLGFVYSSFEASGTRYTSSSCMKHHKVGGFYNNLPVIGYMVKKDGENIGRFLYWTLPDGKHYVDRLYVAKGEYAADILEKIDKEFQSDYKFNVTDSNVLAEYMIPFKSYNAKPNNTFPYIDSFPYLYKRGNEYFLNSNQCHDSDESYKYISTVRTTKMKSRDMGFITYPCCGEPFWVSEIQGKEHKLHCPKYIPRAKKDRELLALFRKLKGE